MAYLPGPVHSVLGCLPPISSAPGHPTHTSPCFPTITLTPHPQRASGPHRFTAASAAIVHHLLCCYVPSLHIFTSSGSWPGPRRVSEAVRGRREDPGTPGLFNCEPRCSGARGPTACLHDAVHGLDLPATTCYTRRRGNPLQGVGGGGRQGPGR